jgi:uncharacterized membrane protein
VRSRPFVAAALATGAEALATEGWDNLFVVVAVVVPLTVLYRQPGEVGLLAEAVGIAVAFGGQLRGPVPHAGGALAAAGLAFSVLAFGGWAWAMPGGAFFVLSSLLSKVGRRRKASAEALAEKGSTGATRVRSTRTGRGVGAAPRLRLRPGHEALYWGFAGAFAAAAADTWGTEIGTLVGGPTRRSVGRAARGARAPRGASRWRVRSGRWPGRRPSSGARCRSPGRMRGRSGRASRRGSSSGGGFAASFVDSVIGATVQARYRDEATGAITERAEAGTLVRGRAWLTNDRVNAVCTLVGALLPLVAFALRSS